MEENKRKHQEQCSDNRMTFKPKLFLPKRITQPSSTSAPHTYTHTFTPTYSQAGQKDTANKYHILAYWQQERNGNPFQDSDVARTIKTSCSQMPLCCLFNSFYIQTHPYTHTHTSMNTPTMQMLRKNCNTYMDRVLFWTPNTYFRAMFTVCCPHISSTHVQVQHASSGVCVCVLATTRTTRQSRGKRMNQSGFAFFPFLEYNDIRPWPKRNCNKARTNFLPKYICRQSVRAWSFILHKN